MPFQVNDKVIYTYNERGDTNSNYKVIEVNKNGTYTIQNTIPTSDGMHVTEYDIPENKLKKKSMFSSVSGLFGTTSGGSRRKSRKTKRSRKSRKSRRKMTKRRRR